ncbi:hypothetical protein [Rhodovulum sp. MB263]|uniref:hypothetical protein n=1 Tax=Rhodovulum sp. (strain MB263) TaxID=308754 RepID=UPI0018C8ACD4|nr:hypothetical protein [Rhodovulum sp. MB263]
MAVAIAVVMHLRRLAPLSGSGSEAGLVRGLQTTRLQVVMGFPVVSGWLHVLRPFCGERHSRVLSSGIPRFQFRFVDLHQDNPVLEGFSQENRENRRNTVAECRKSRLPKSLKRQHSDIAGLRLPKGQPTARTAVVPGPAERESPPRTATTPRQNQHGGYRPPFTLSAAAGIGWVAA